jgi:hypothetical protein
LIAPGRGYEHAVEVLGEGYTGVLERDGWAPYGRFANARHETCDADLLRRTGVLLADSIAGQARVPHAARWILKDALALRDQRDEGVIDAGVRSESHGSERADRQAASDAPAPLSPTVGCSRIWSPSVSASSRAWPSPMCRRPTGVPSRRFGRRQNIDPLEVMINAQHSRQPTVSELIKLPARASPTTLAAWEAMPKPTPIPETRYRIVCYELVGRSSNRHPRCHRQAFIAVTGTIDEHNTMTGQGTHAGPLPLLRRLASVIADDERLTSWRSAPSDGTR